MHLTAMGATALTDRNSGRPLRQYESASYGHNTFLLIAEVLLQYLFVAKLKFYLPP